MFKNSLAKRTIGATISTLLAFFGVVALQTPARAAACGDGTLPSVELVSDPIMYSGLGDGYDANYIAYKITAGSQAVTNLTVKLETFTGGRIALATSQAATQSYGQLTAPVFSYFLAKMTGTSSTAQAHTYVISDGASELCRGTTTLNSATEGPAANKNNSNKVDSITVSNAPADTVGSQITATVKGQTGTIGAAGTLSFAPISNSSFPADKWSLVGVSIKLNQDATWTDQAGTVPLSGNLFYTNQGSNGGYYTATYTFKLIATTSSTTVIKPIQYVASGANIVYTGTMPQASATIQTASASPVAASISPASQTISATVNSAITDSDAISYVGFSPAPTYAISPALPAGLTLNTTTGVISGTPTVTAATANYTITASNTANPVQSATASVSITVSAAPQVQNTPELDRKVTICHRTHAINNPYVRITVDYNSVNKEKGHKGHNDSFQGKGVYTAGIYKRAKDKLWGDIIPPDNAAINAGVSPRWQPLNWSIEGQAIYNGTAFGCPSKFDAKAYYNALREAGVPVKDIKAEIEELEAEQATANPTIEKTKVENLKYDGTNSKVLEEENDKVTICHRTNSVTNPYRRITVAASSIYKKSGHYGHDEIYDGNEVFDSTVNYPTNRKDWGDIIPADPTGKNRWKALNWTTLGQAIYNGTVAGCEEVDNQEFYNELREEGKTKKEIKADLEAQKNIDDDPKDIDEIKYTGEDPDVQKNEPKEPVLPPNQVVPDQSLSGIVWLDLNRDGIKDPLEPLMKGIALTVVQVTSIQSQQSASSVQEGAFRSATSLDGVRVLKNQFKAAATVVVQTDENGFYIFPSLGAGDWRVTTAVPPQLGVTYDSEGGPEGEVVTKVPVASHAFTWVGLVGDDQKLNDTIEKAIEEAGEEGTVTISPNGTVTITKGSIVTTISPSGKVVTIDTNDPQLAATGSYDLLFLMFGLLLTAVGAVALIWDRRRPARTKL